MLGLLKIFKRIKKRAKPPLPSAPHIGQLFKERYDSFKAVLAENNAVLEIMADMEEKLSGDYLFDMSYVRSSCEHVVEKIQNIIENLNKLSNGKYKNLRDAFEKINSDIAVSLTREAEVPVTDFTIPFEQITKDMVSSAGGKNANLGGNQK